MISKNITKDDVLRSMADIDKFGVPPRRQSWKYDVTNGGRRYPPPYVICVANRYANGVELEPYECKANEAIPLLRSLGFAIVKK